MKRIAVAAAFSVSSVLALGGCATYHDELARGENAFEANEHEKALAIFRVLEPDLSHLDAAERARYDYLRGMTDYRIGYKSDARHWLLLATVEEKNKPGTLPDAWKERMTSAVDELDGAVFDDGTGSLSSDKKAPTDEPAKKSEDVP
ncbi:MAG TPA: hypothetical protein VF407_10040 [Polyangiaceae bacterium]